MSTMKILNIVNLINLPALLLLFFLLISGCATGSKDSIFPQDGLTMKEVYEGHFTGERADQNNGEETETETKNKNSNNKVVSMQSTRLITRRHDTNHNVDNDLSSYTRTAHNEIQQIFPRLRNKTLIMYIFPHLSKGERHPIPGYSTAFTMYKQTEYALPGESTEGY